MKRKIGWFHPVDDSDQFDGFNESGIETFRGEPIISLAREINQNALDAAESESATVEVSFRLIEVPTDNIPNLDQLQATLKKCADASVNEGQKAALFFKNALEAIKKKKIKVLVVSEENTRGMKGPSQNGTPFYAFMKAKGQSKKDTDTAGGSYGIGKHAPYTVSAIRTIFVSTVYEAKKGTWAQLTQGKSILISHYKGGHLQRGVGFWGEIDKCQPVEGISGDLPGWLQRVEKKDDLPKRKGTNICILCFDAIENWQELLAVSVAENFFAAIQDNKLRVKIEDKYTLDKQTLAGFLSDHGIKKIIDGIDNEPERFDNSRHYLEVLSNDTETIPEDSETRELGLCRIRILLGEGLPKKVCFLRNGMFISDSLNRLRSFPDFKEFVAVVECKSQKGNELLRAMEPPRHDDFEHARLPSKEDQQRGKRALNDLAKWIREMLKRHAKDPVSDTTEIDELRDFFGDEGEHGTGKGLEDINPSGKLVIRAKPIKRPSPSTAAGDGEEGGGAEPAGEGGGGGGGGGGGNDNGGRGRTEDGSGKGGQKASVSLTNIRGIVTGNRTRTVFFTSAISGQVSIRLLEAGADADYEVEVVKTNQGSVSNGAISMNVTAGSRNKVKIELNEDFLGAIKVVANEI
jgi:hypothetical protein